LHTTPTISKLHVESSFITSPINVPTTFRSPKLHCVAFQIKVLMSSSKQHAWEQYGSQHKWEADDYDCWKDSDEDELSNSPEAAGEELADMLVNLRLRGVLSSKQACVLGHWASLAGAVGPCSEFAIINANWMHTSG
jgi:hypothetical protein